MLCVRAFVCLVVVSLPRLEDSYVVVVVVVVVSCLHGADVLQGFHSIISHSKLKDSLSPTLKFAALTAALVHDIGHPGRNNKFLIDSKKTRTDVVVLLLFLRCRCFSMLLFCLFLSYYFFFFFFFFNYSIPGISVARHCHTIQRSICT